MAAEPLSGELRKAGVEMLVELDRIGIRPQGAMWLYAHHLRDWRYAIMSDLVDEIGRRKLYGMIGEALDKIGPVHGLTIFDVHLYDMTEIVPRVLGGAMTVPGVSEVTVSDCNFNGMRTDGIIYRIVPARDSAERKRSVRDFEKTLKQLLAV